MGEVLHRLLIYLKIIISAIKKAEDRDSMIVRLFNPTHETQIGKITLYFKIEEAWICNLNEDRQESLNKICEVKVEPNKIIPIEFII